MSKNNDMMQDLLYMQSLQPEIGCKTDFAVGTTFSLSMEGLVAVPLALSKLGESKKMNDRTALYLMEGIRRAADKFVVFCNKSSIHVPANSQPLYSLLEDSVVEVAESDNPLANFHPKLWVVREVSNEGECWIKVLITSRNLTFSTDLDAAVVLRGRVCKNTTNIKNKPLADMLRILADRYDPDGSRKSKIKKIADDIERVDSFDLESPFSNKVYEFHPMMMEGFGTSKRLNSSSLINRLFGKRVLVVTPFIDSNQNSGVLKNIIDNTDELFLVTNDNNVTEELYNMLPGHIYVPNAILTEDEESPVRLHAKMYVVEQSNGAVYMYIGSANATNSGFRRNGELIIGMRINHSTFDEIFEEIVTKEAMYIPVDGATANAEEEAEKQETQNMLDHILRWAINSMGNASIVKKRDNEINPFEVSININQQDKSLYHITNLNDYNISVRPLQLKNDWRKFDKEKLQWQLRLEELSEFYVIEVSDNNNHNTSKQNVCKVVTEGLDRFINLRNDQIVNSIIKSDNIMQYLDMILSEFPEYSFENWEKRKKHGPSQNVYNSNMFDGVAIYEKLLKASYESPERIKDLKEIVSKLNSNEHSNDLKTLLTAFGINFRNKKK